MNSAMHEIRIIDGEFTIDDVDWRDLAAADVKAGVADLLKHGLVIENEEGSFQRTGKGDGEKGWWATSRAVQRLSSTGRAAFTILVTLDVVRLAAEIQEQTKGARTEDIFDLINEIDA